MLGLFLSAENPEEAMLLLRSEDELEHFLF